MDPGAGNVSLQCDSSPIFGTIQKVGEDSSKSVTTTTTDTNSQSPICPKCKKNSTWRNGHRNPLFGKSIQRWICRDCGYRFADPSDVAKAKEEFQLMQLIESNRLKSSDHLINNCQICDKMSKFSVNPTKETKNLVSELVVQKN